MRTSLGQMNGDDWEDYCQKLLRLRYLDYQEVPAQFGGDYGIEGFTRSGLVFQCYCPDEDLSGRDLYEHQRDKIARDIGKLLKNASKISALGAGIIKEWHFLTPDYNSHALLTHCRSKEEEVRSKGLPSIYREFIISVRTEDHYIPERQIYLGTGEHRVQPSIEEPQADTLEALMSSGNKIVCNIKTKLDKIEIKQNRRAKLTRELVSGYVVGQAELEKLNEKFPSTYKSIMQLKSAIGSQLVIRTLDSSGNHGAMLHQTLNEYEAKLYDNFSRYLSSALISRLSYGAISEWLGLCPLDFDK